MGSNKPARWWIGTIHEHHNVLFWEPAWLRDPLPSPLAYLRGQLERGSENDTDHWQLLASFSRPVRLSQVKSVICNGHWEPTKSDKARDYVWKEDTAFAETRFEVGAEPIRRNEASDWERIRVSAKAGNFDEIPADVYVRYYSSLNRIAADHASPVAIERNCYVFWGPTGTGKSKRAWEEAGLSAYCKDPRSKWWCGYRNQQHVVIDEFRGGIDISHMLRWLDRYPVSVETKGSARPLLAKSVWITSNLDPRCWYPDLDTETVEALMRRLTITHFNKEL